jgi:hypothetical protein
VLRRRYGRAGRGRLSAAVAVAAADVRCAARWESWAVAPRQAGWARGRADRARGRRRGKGCGRAPSRVSAPLAGWERRSTGGRGGRVHRATPGRPGPWSRTASGSRGAGRVFPVRQAGPALGGGELAEGVPLAFGQRRRLGAVVKAGFSRSKVAWSVRDLVVCGGRAWFASGPRGPGCLALLGCVRPVGRLKRRRGGERPDGAVAPC